MIINPSVTNFARVRAELNLVEASVPLTLIMQIANISNGAIGLQSKPNTGTLVRY